ncbi:MAG TPA: hypothetical protein VEP73_00595 [Actinomycetota bacterium]|nr:hypothetical protein [Actinomycetota bacterium]
MVRLCREHKLNAISMAMEEQLLAALEREPVALPHPTVAAESSREAALLIERLAYAALNQTPEARRL